MTSGIYVTYLIFICCSHRPSPAGKATRGCFVQILCCLLWLSLELAPVPSQHQNKFCVCKPKRRELTALVFAMNPASKCSG